MTTDNPIDGTACGLGFEDEAKFAKDELLLFMLEMLAIWVIGLITGFMIAWGVL